MRLSPKMVRVELDESGLPCRIFRDKGWRNLPSELVQTLTKAKAVEMIRARVFYRSKNDNDQAECEKCGRYITWDTMEMNERKLKSLGGEVSLENCEALCRECHQTGPDAFHGNRRWQTTKIQVQQGSK